MYGDDLHKKGKEILPLLIGRALRLMQVTVSHVRRLFHYDFEVQFRYLFGVIMLARRSLTPLIS
jgi:hypothetical protein